MREINLNKQCNYIHLASGGLDSAYSLLKIAKKKKENEPHAVIHPIFFDYGQYATETEWSSAVKVIEYIRDYLGDKKVVDDPIRISLKSQDLFQWSRSVAFQGLEGDNTTAEIENRNLVLFSVLASYLIACANHQNITNTHFEITSGFKDGEIADSNKAFFKQFADLLHSYKKDYTFDFKILPNKDFLWIKTKTLDLLHGSETELKKFRARTISCYYPIDGRACKKCIKCTSIDNEKALRR